MKEAYRLYLLSNENNRFFCDRGKNVIHDRQCCQLGKIKEADVMPLSEISKNYLKKRKLCSVCKRRLAIRNGMRGVMRNSESQMQAFMKILGKAGATDEDLVRLFIKNKGTISYVSTESIGIKVREDQWRVALLGGKPQLYHNSYRILPDHEREFTGKFHLQDTNGRSSFHTFTGIICSYSYEGFHKQKLDAYDRKVQTCRLQGCLALVDNYMRVDHPSLLYHYYTFVDICDAACSVGGLRHIQLLNSDGDYSLVTCKIPKWREKDFRNTMLNLKKLALQDARHEYIQYCETSIRQIG